MHFTTSTLGRSLAAMAAVATIALAGCSGSSGSDGSGASPSVSAPSSAVSSSESPSAATPSASASQDTQGNTAMLAAGTLAAKKVPGGTVTSIEAERGGWEVHVVTDDGGEQQLRVDQAGTTLISGPTDERPDADDRAENRRFAKAQVDYRQAVRAVEDEINSGQIDELNLDLERGRVVWEADVSVGSQRRSVQLDADSGQVISNRVDD